MCMNANRRSQKLSLLYIVAENVLGDSRFLNSKIVDTGMHAVYVIELNAVFVIEQIFKTCLCFW